MKFSFKKTISEKITNSNQIYELTHEEEDLLEKNLVWIFASPRSGTQWLGTQLLEHNTIICHGPSLGLNVGSIHGGFNDKIVRWIDFRGDEEDYFFSKKYQAQWIYFMRKFILNRLFLQYRELSKKIILPDPEGSIGGDIIEKCTPSSKVILLLRDGRDVVDSVIDAGRPDSWHVKSRGVTPITQKNRIKRIRQASRRWVKQTEIIQEVFQNHDPNFCLKIKYEDLRKDTLKNLTKIYNFIEEEISNEQLAHIINKYNFEKIPENKKGSGKVTRSASPGKWKESFSEEEKEIMIEIMSEKLKEFGYQT
jgi:hypothetical protein